MVHTYSRDEKKQQKQNTSRREMLRENVNFEEKKGWNVVVCNGSNECIYTYFVCACLWVNVSSERKIRVYRRIFLWKTRAHLKWKNALITSASWYVWQCDVSDQYTTVWFWFSSWAYFHILGILLQFFLLNLKYGKLRRSLALRQSNSGI